MACRLQLLLFVCLLFVQVSCNSRYKASNCPGTLFPESHIFLVAPGFSRLAFFQSRFYDKSPADHEIWADQRFEFTLALQYHYAKDDLTTLDCPKGVSLVMKFPPSPENRREGEKFIQLFEQAVQTDFTKVRAAWWRLIEGSAGLAEPPIRVGPLVAEVSVVAHPHRGNLLSVGVYEHNYFRSFLAIPK